MKDKLGIVILAAGLGKRMKSHKAKVLHEICGRPMIHFVVQTANALAGSNVIVVVGHQAEKVKQVLSRDYVVSFALQEQQLGTGHAVLCAMSHIADAVEDVVILCGDVPLISVATIEQMVDEHRANQRDLTLLAVKLSEPAGYGRVLFDPQGELIGIVEEADADVEQKKIDLINSGIYAVKRSYLNEVLPQIDADNAQNEIYLTDIVGIGYRRKKAIGAVIGRDSDEIIGVNSQAELQDAEKLMKIKKMEKS